MKVGEETLCFKPFSLSCTVGLPFQRQGDNSTYKWTCRKASDLITRLKDTPPAPQPAGLLCWQAGWGCSPLQYSQLSFYPAYHLKEMQGGVHTLVLQNIRGQTANIPIFYFGVLQLKKFFFIRGFFGVAWLLWEVRSSAGARLAWHAVLLRCRRGCN